MLIYVPSEHNPSDYPSRGVRLPGKRFRPLAALRCPDCGQLAENQLLHVPKRLRGRGLACTSRTGWGHAFVDGEWIPQVDLDVQRIISVKQRRSVKRRCFHGWAALAFGHE